MDFDAPICQFGPGGDAVRTYPRGAKPLPAQMPWDAGGGGVPGPAEMAGEDEMVLAAASAEMAELGLKPLAPTLEAVHRQGGLCVIPHPMSWITRSIGQRTIERVLSEGGDGVSFDGIETSGGPAARFGRKKARRLHRERFHLAEVGGSDAHRLDEIGHCITVFHEPVTDDGQLVAALRAGAFAAEVVRESDAATP